MPTTFGVDVSEMRKFTRDLRKVAPDVSKGLRKNLRLAGLLVAADAKKRAGEHSKTISKTIRVGVVASSVEIRAGNANTPIALLYERGNHGTHGEPSSFRHPVFGNDVWVEQRAYPFLTPAVDASRVAVVAQIGASLDDALEAFKLGR